MPINLRISKFFLYLVPFTLLIVYQDSIFPFIVGKYVFFRVVVGLALVFFVWGWARGELTTYDQLTTKDKNRFGSSVVGRRLLVNPLTIAVAAFTFIFLLACLTSYNPAASFWSNFERGEGGLQILNLFIFFTLLVFLFRDKKSWLRLFAVSLWAAGSVIVYGVLGAMHVNGFLGDNLCQRFSGSLGNSAYLGTYMIFTIFYAGYLFFDDKKSAAKKVALAFFAVAFFIFLILSQTRGALLGLGAGIMAALFYLLFRLRERRKKYLMLGIILFLSALSFVVLKYRHTLDIMPFCKNYGGNQIVDVDLGTNTFQTRLMLWKGAVISWKERPILGWGPENFSVPFEKHYDPFFTVWYDRAHNIFFDYLVFAGALGLLSFIGIFLAYFWKFFKSQKKPAASGAEPVLYKKPEFTIINQKSIMKNALLLAIPIAYLVQGLVLFDVLPIYINLFIVLAFANFVFSEEKLKNG